MLRGELPTNIKAIICRASGKRIEGEDLTVYVLEYALNNRDEFNMVYIGDIVEAPAAPSAPAEDDLGKPIVFSESDLKGMNKGPLIDLCVQRGILVDSDQTKAELIDLILAEEGK